jgi:hypothetical protein
MSNQHRIPVTGTIDENGNVHIDTAFLPDWHNIQIAGSIWPLLPAETRAMVVPFITSRDQTGVNCWMPETMFMSIVPAIKTAAGRLVIRPGIDAEEFARYLELINMQAEMGFPLALHPVLIAKIETEGGVVDLETGAVSWLAEAREGD